jgi:hypothetical protein
LATVPVSANQYGGFVLLGLNGSGGAPAMFGAGGGGTGNMTTSEAGSNGIVVISW